MTNRWGIPAWLEEKVRRRDKFCVYCHVKLRGKKNFGPSFEHIDNNGSSKKEWNIAMCCNSCNRSKGTKKLLNWLGTPYCKRRKITKANVAKIIKDYIKKKT